MGRDGYVPICIIQEPKKQPAIFPVPALLSIIVNNSLTTRVANASPMFQLIFIDCLIETQIILVNNGLQSRFENNILMSQNKIHDRSGFCNCLWCLIRAAKGRTAYEAFDHDHDIDQ